MADNPQAPTRTPTMTDNLETTPTTFQREERFIVVKRKQITCEQEYALHAFLREQGIGTVECVVVESDWPEYETVWQMIEARHTGKPIATAREVEGLRAKLAELAKAEADYRRLHDIYGGSHIQTGRAWDRMRHAGDAARAALAGKGG